MKLYEKPTSDTETFLFEEAFYNPGAEEHYTYSIESIRK